MKFFVIFLLAALALQDLEAKHNKKHHHLKHHTKKHGHESRTIATTTYTAGQTAACGNFCSTGFLFKITLPQESLNIIYDSLSSTLAFVNLQKKVILAVSRNLKGTARVNLVTQRVVVFDENNRIAAAPVTISTSALNSINVDLPTAAGVVRNIGLLLQNYRYYNNPVLALQNGGTRASSGDILFTIASALPDKLLTVFLNLFIIHFQSDDGFGDGPSLYSKLSNLVFLKAAAVNSNIGGFLLNPTLSITVFSSNNVPIFTITPTGKIIRIGQIQGNIDNVSSLPNSVPLPNNVYRTVLYPTTVNIGGPTPGLTLPGGILPGGIVPGGIVPGGIIPGGILPGLNLPVGNLPGLNLPVGNLPGLNLPVGNLPGVNLPTGNLPGVNLPVGNLPGVNLPLGNLPGVNLPGGNLPGVNLPGGNVPSPVLDLLNSLLSSNGLVPDALSGVAGPNGILSSVLGPNGNLPSLGGPNVNLPNLSGPNLGVGAGVQTGAKTQSGPSAGVDLSSLLSSLGVSGGAQTGSNNQGGASGGVDLSSLLSSLGVGGGAQAGSNNQGGASAGVDLSSLLSSLGAGGSAQAGSNNQGGASAGVDVSSLLSSLGLGGNAQAGSNNQGGASAGVDLSSLLGSLGSAQAGLGSNIQLGGSGGLGAGVSTQGGPAVSGGWRSQH